MSRRIIPPSLPLSLFPSVAFQPCLITGLSYRVIVGAGSGRDLAPTEAAGRINLLSLKCWKLCKCQMHLPDVLAEEGGMLGERVAYEPSAEAGPLLPFVAGVFQWQMLLHPLGLWSAGDFFSILFFWQGCLVCDHLGERQSTRGLTPVRLSTLLIFVKGPLTKRCTVKRSI